jgi:uncharacterized protein (TIGR03086 family)
MTDLTPLFDAGLAEFGMRVHRVGADQWAAPTPCSDWDVGALVDHLIDEHLWVPPLLSGDDLDTASAIVESAKRTIGADRAAAWDAAALASQRAIGEPGALDRRVALSRGPTPVREYLIEMISDLAIHSWDLGRAIGVDEPLPEELVRFSMPLIQRYQGAEPWFAAPVPAPVDATDEERLIALAGRQPR